MGGRRRFRDSYSRRASRESYPARSVYKLEEIDRRTQLLRKGDRVLDLGAAPGSWTIFASDRVGRGGRVAAVDIQPLRIDPPANAAAIEADVLELEPAELPAEAGVDAFDVVLSDMAPSTTGHRFVDQTRSFRLYDRALEIASLLTGRGGRFAGKIFQGEDFETARERTRELFEKVRVIRPRSVRSESYEIYLVGLGRR